jgi:hypothetical protein
VSVSGEGGPRPYADACPLLTAQRADAQVRQSDLVPAAQLFTHSQHTRCTLLGQCPCATRHAVSISAFFCSLRPLVLRPSHHTYRLDVASPPAVCCRVFYADHKAKHKTSCCLLEKSALFKKAFLGVYTAALFIIIIIN